MRQNPFGDWSLFRQLNPIRVLPFAFVLLGENFFEPTGVTLGDCLVQKCRVVNNDKFLTATVTAKSAQLCKTGRTFSRLALLYGYCSHRLLHSIETLSRSL